MTSPYATFKELAGMGVPYCRLHLHRLARQGKFPVAYQLSNNRVAWRVSEIEAWLAERPVRQSVPEGQRWRPGAEVDATV
jgi:predicted DNA-binding transcriptional regulator AlpA